MSPLGVKPQPDKPIDNYFPPTDFSAQSNRNPTDYLKKIDKKKWVPVILIGSGLFLFIVSLLLQRFGSGLNFNPFSGTKQNRVTTETVTDLSLTAKEKNQAGVTGNSSFVLSSLHPVEAKSIASSLKILPQTDFDIRQIDENNLEIKPANTLEQGEVYRFILASNNSQGNPRDISWAFQIESPLNISGSLPADKATGVPTNSSVEIFFSNPDYIEAEKNFEINPPTLGRFEKYQNTLVFIPESLQPLTLYKVTLKKGTALSDQSSSITSDYVFQFETGQDVKKLVNKLVFSRTILEVNPNNVSSIPLNMWEIPGGSKNTKVYSLPVSRFLSCLNYRLAIPSWSRYGLTQANCDVSGLTPVMEFTADIKRVSEYGQFYFDLPNKIDKGFYLLSIENEDGQAGSQQLIQSTSLSWYSWYGEKQSIFWVNDLLTKKPSAAAIYQDDRVLGQTDSNGVSRFETTPEINNRKPQLLKISSVGDSWYTIVNDVQGGSSGWAYDYFDSAGKIISDSYWSFIFTDRELYLPTDRINFWGVLKKREGILGKFSLRLYSNAVNFSGNKSIDDQPSLTEKDILLSDNNTFIGSFDLKDLSPGYYYLVAVDGGKVVNYKSIRVQTFQKPSYKISLKPRKVAVWAGESNSVDVKVSFWDGTPVSNLVLTYEGGDGNGGEVKTNLLGQAVIETKSEYQEGKDKYWPVSQTLSIKPKLPEEGEIAGEVTYFTFGPDIETKTESSWDSSGATIKLTATKVNLTEKEKEPWSTGTQPVVDLKYTVTIERTWSEQIDNGEYYDPVEKMVRKKYRYEPRRELVNTQEVTTDKQGEARVNFTPAEKQSYEVYFSARDSRNRLTKSTGYVYGGSNNSYDRDKLTITGNNKSYQLGDNGALSLEYQSQPVPQGGDNRFLIIGSQLGKLLSHDVLSGDSWSFQFIPEYIPNVWINAVWFDGSRYRLTVTDWRNNGTNLIYNSEGKEVEIKTTPDKDKYQPGDEVKLNIKITKQGTPVSQARVLVSGVDEALTDIGGISTQSLLGQLYKTVSDGRVYSYTTHPYLISQPGAEGGGGGGERIKFENTTVFSEQTTNQNGETEIKFKLPDNITTWRITVLAVNRDLLAGQVDILLPVTKPLFVNLITADEFVSADKPTVRAVAYGDAIDNDQPVTYQFSSPDLEISVASQEKPAFIPAETPIGLTKIGNKEIKTTAKQNGNDDTLVRKITILKDRSGFPKFDHLNLLSTYRPSFSGYRNPTFIVADYGLAAWYQKLILLSQQMIYGKNDRVDRIASQIRAKEILRDNFGEKVEINENIDGFQNGDGYSLLRYSNTDLLTTVKIAALRLNQSNRLSLVQALWKFFNKENSIENASLALWGLAETNEPVLTMIQNLAVKDNTELGYMYLALGAASLGDQELGRKTYQQMIEKYGQKEGSVIYVKIGDTRESYIQATALSLILGAKLGQDEVEMLWNYLDQNISAVTLYSLEKVIAIQSFLNNAPSDNSSFEYNLDGRNKTVSLNGETWRIEVPSDSISSFSLKPITGKISVAALWYERGAEGSGKPEPGLNISGSISPALKVGLDSVVEVELNSTVDDKLPAGNYLVEVLLPSGLRYIKAPLRIDLSSDWHYSWPVVQDGNRLVFWADTTLGIRFLARPINKGEFSFEPIKIYNQNAPQTYNQFSLGEKLVIE